MEVLFKKTVPVRLKPVGSEERHASVGVTILLNTVSSPVLKKNLMIRLTDERDPFFLYTLALGEDDFQGLKVQQGLLVDFSLFPCKLIDLLEQCLSEVGKENPRFLLQFCPSTTPHTPSLLNVVETNPFRHLNHLSLRFVPAGDEQLKKYLAECLIHMKEENTGLSSCLAGTKSDLSGRLACCEEALAARTQELERLKSDWSSQAATLSSEHTSNLNMEREKTLETQKKAQWSFEQEKRDLEQAHQAKVSSLESRLQEVGGANKELTDLKYRLEGSVRELGVKLKTAEEECAGMREELQRLRKENSALDASAHEQDKAITQLRTRLAVLEQELQDKEQMIGRVSDLLEVAKEQKRSGEGQLEQSRRDVSKLEASYKSLSKEFTKGKEVIQKLISEMHNIKSKLKAKNLVTVQQEKLLGEKTLKVQQLEQEVEGARKTLVVREEELVKSRTSLEETAAGLEQTREQLKTSENVVAWLNKRENDHVLERGSRHVLSLPHSHALSSVPPLPSYSGGSGGMLSSIRPPAAATVGTGISSPQPPLAQRYPPITSYAGMQLQTKPQYSSTPAGAGDGLSTQQLPPPQQPQRGRHVLGPLGSQENIAKQQVVFRGGKKTLLSPLVEHAQLAGSGAGAGVSPSDRRPPGEPWLDPKYLPPEPQPMGSEGTSQTTSGGLYITPGVLIHNQAAQKAAGGRDRMQGELLAGGKKSVGGGLKPTLLTSSY